MQKTHALGLSVGAALLLVAVSALGYLGKVGDIFIAPTLLAVFGTSKNVHQPDPNGFIVAGAVIANIAILALLFYIAVKLLVHTHNNGKSKKH